MQFTYDYNAVKTEAGFWIIEPEKITEIAQDFCPENGEITLNMPIGDYFCTELTKPRSRYKATNQHQGAQFDTLSIVLPRILDMPAEDRFSDDYYNKVLPDDYYRPPDNDSDIPPHLPELTRIREVLKLWYEDAMPNTPGTSLLERLKTAFKVLVKGIRTSDLSGDDFQSHREMFWYYMSEVLWFIYGEDLRSGHLRWEREDSSKIIEGLLPTMLPIGGYGRQLWRYVPPQKNPPTVSFDSMKTRSYEVPQDIPHEDISTAEEAEVFKRLFCFLIDFFSGAVDTAGRAEQNAQTRAPQNIFILLRQFCDESLLTEFDFRTGTSSDFISNAKDFEKLKNQASLFLEQPLNADSRNHKDFLDPLPKSTAKQRGKTRAIYELLSGALDTKRRRMPPAENPNREENRQIQNAKNWEVRDFKTILQKWLKAIDPRMHDRLYELWAHENENPKFGKDTTGRIQHPLFRIFETVAGESPPRLRLGRIERDDFAVFFYFLFFLYEQTD